MIARLYNRSKKQIALDQHDGYFGKPRKVELNVYRRPDDAVPFETLHFVDKREARKYCEERYIKPYNF